MEVQKKSKTRKTPWTATKAYVAHQTAAANNKLGVSEWPIKHYHQQRDIAKSPDHEIPIKKKKRNNKKMNHLANVKQMNPGVYETKPQMKWNRGLSEGAYYTQKTSIKLFRAHKNDTCLKIKQQIYFHNFRIINNITLYCNSSNFLEILKL